MNPNHDSESQDSSPSPVRRANTRTSCDLCKKQKIKCERQGDTCIHCIERGATCKTTIVERKRREVKRLDPGSIVEMEERINRLEAVIVASGLESQTRRESSPGDETPPPAANVTDRLSTLLIDEEGTSHFLGSSSGFSLFSPQGLQWISKRTGSTELPHFIKNMIKRLRKTLDKGSQLNRKRDLWSPTPRSSHEPPPPKHIADQWIKCYFDTFNAMLPLYDKDIFDIYYAQQYSALPPSGSAWYASFNVVLAIGGIIRENHSHGEGRSPTGGFPIFSDTQFLKYFRNAASCFLDLAFQEPNLLVVQAMCGLLNLEPHPSYILTAAAGRMAYTIGLHRTLDYVDDSGLTEVEINQRMNVFWVVYILDKALALRLGHPSVMNDNDIGVDLPKEHKGFHFYPDGSRRHDIFRLQVQLALLEGRTYTDLYSAAARKKSVLERLRSVGEIDKELQAWRMSVPVEIRPDESIRCVYNQFPPVFLLHFEFFHCLSTIHRVSIHHGGSWTNDDGNKMVQAPHNPQLNPRVYSSQSICLEAARSTIKLLRYVDIVGRFRNFIWTQMYYPLSAFLVLFANTLHNPEDPSTPADIELMDLVISVLSPMVGHTGAFNADASLQLFEELRNVTKKFLESNYRDQPKRMKRGYGSELLKPDGSPSVVAALQNSTALPRTQGSPSQIFVQHIAQPLQPNMQQYLQPFNNTNTDVTQTMPLDETSFPTLGFDAFLYSENFEWDLANLWKQDYTPSPH